MKNKYWNIALILFCVGVLLVGSYAFFVYDKESEKEVQMIAGSIYLEANDLGDIELSDMYPMSDEDGIKNGAKYQLNIRGHNESEKDLFYGIYLNQGAEVEGKKRLKDDEIKVYLTQTVNEETTVVYGPGVLKDFNNKLIHADIINEKTTPENEVEIDYELTVWIDEKVLISDSIEEVEGKRVYTSEEFKNSYATVVPTVIGDFKEKDANLEVNTKATLMTSGKEYDVSKDYLTTLFTEENVKVEISTEKKVTKFVITNAVTKEITEEVPETINGKSVVEIEYSESGSYAYYGVYEDGTTSTIDTYNIKIDKEIPVFVMQNGGSYNVDNSESFYKIENKITGIVEENDYSLMYALVEKDKSVDEYNKIELNDQNTIVVNAKSGIYDLYVKMEDEAGKEKIDKTSYTISYTSEIVNNNSEVTLSKTTQKLVTGQTYEFLEKLPVIEHDDFLGYATDSRGINIIGKDTKVAEGIEKIYAIYNSVGLLVKPTSSVCNDLTYNGQNQKLTKEASKGFSYDVTEGKDAGSYTITATLDEKYMWDDETTDDVTITCDIKKKDITYKADDASKVYDGKALTKNTATIKEGSLAAGHTATLTIEGTITEVGTAINELKNVVIKDANGNDVSKNYEIKKENGTLTVSQAPASITIEEKEATYNGNKVEVDEAQTNSDGNVTYTYYSGDSCSGTALTSAPIDAGTYSVKATVAATTNYPSATSNCVKLVIKQKEITPTVTVSDKTYDGNTTATCNVTLNGVVTGDKVTATSTGTFNNKNAGTNKEVTCGSIALSGDDAKNYKLTETSKKTTGDINAKSIDVSKLTYSPLTKVYDGKTTVPSGFKVTPTTESGLISGDTITIGYTNAAYNDADVADANSIVVSGMSISGTSASNYTLSNTSYTKTGATITKAAGTISLESKTATYSGSVISAATALANSNGTITYAYYNGDSCDGTALSGAPTNAGTYSVKATVAQTGNYTSATTNCIKHTINKIAVTYKADNATKVYDGKALTKNTATKVSGTLVSGHTATFTISGTITNVGTATNTLNAVTIKNSGGTDVSANYEITKQNGTLTITQATGTISLSPKTEIYSGSAIAANTAETNSGGTITYTYYSGNACSGTALSGAPTNAGTYSVKATVAQTANYTSATTNCIAHTISKRAVTYKADDATKIYDGTALTKNTAKLVSGTLVNGHTATFTISGTITNVGTATNTLTAVTIKNSGGTDVTANYEITKQNGTLKVTEAQAEKPSANEYCKTLTYNGANQTVTKDPATGYSFSGNTGINAGTYEVTAKLDDGFEWIDGTTADVVFECTMSQIAITYKADSATKVYDGKALTKNTATKVSGELVSGHTASFTISGTITNVGEVANTLTAVTIKNAGGTDVTSNYKITRQNGKLTITKATGTISMDAITSTYSGSPIIPTDPDTNSDGEVTYEYYNGDSCSGTALTSAPTNAGTYSVIAKLSASTNYTGATSECKKILINQKSITFTAEANDKTYDGNTSATCKITLNGIATGDTVSSTSTGTFDNKNAGTDKTVTCGNVTLTGTDANNYKLSSTSTTTKADITKKSITAEANVNNKVYDGNTTATCNITLTGVVTGDTVSATAGSGAFADRNAGTNKKVTCSSITLSGANAGNYILSNTSDEATANITAKSLTVANFTYSPLTKVYDGNTTAPSGFKVTATNNSGLVSGDTVTVAFTGAVYNDADVADASSIAVSGMSISGTSASNYTLSGTTYTKTGATITKATGTISLSPKTETYNGSAIAANTATINSGGTITYTYYNGNACSGTALNGAPTNAGTYSVKATVAATGNYTTATTDCITHTISKRAVTYKADDASKVFDGTPLTKNTATLKSGTLVSGHTATFTISGSITNVGSTTNTLSAVTIKNAGGTDVTANYEITKQNGTLTVTNAQATISLGTTTVTYTGNPVTPVKPTTNSDGEITYTYYNGDSCSGTALTSAPIDAETYSVKATVKATTNYASATSVCAKIIINAKSITYTTSADDKVYDGNTNATCKITLSGVVSGDTVSATSTGTFADKNAGTDKNVTCGSIALTGTDAKNYSLSSTSTTVKADITPKSLNVADFTYSPLTKVYDKGTGAPSGFKVTATTNSGLVSGDTVTVAFTNATYNDADVADASSIAVSGMSLSGTSASNYTLSNTGYTKTGATITKATGTISLSPKTETYTGSAIAANTATTNSGGTVTYTYYNGNSCSGTALSGAPTNAGTYSVIASVAQTANYTSATTDCIAHTINQKTLTVANFTYSPLIKGYDGKTNAPSGFKVTATTNSGLVSGDTVTVAFTSATYNDADVADASSIAVSGISISGTDAGNYKLSATSYTKTGATITKATGTVSISAKTETYTGSAISVPPATTNSGGTVTYTYYSGDACSGTALSGAPTNAGTYSVIATVAATGNYTTATSSCVKLTINKIAVTYKADDASKVFDGTPLTKNTATLKSGSLVSGHTATFTISGTITNVGSTTNTLSAVTIKNSGGTDVTANYEITKQNGTLTVTNAQATISLGTTTVTYTGNPVTPVKPTTNSDGEVTYTYYNGDSCSGTALTSAPIDAETYSVKATVKATTNYASATSVCAKIIINAKSITYTASADDKVYDGNTNATCKITLSGVVSGDTVSATSTGTFADKNAETDKNVTCGSIALTGTDAKNYSLSSTSTTVKADITPKSITPTATASNKTYNGNTTANCTIALTGTVSGDTVTASAGSGAFADKNVGTGKKVTCSSITLSGTSAGNYTLSTTSAETTANITAKSLTPTATASNKTYNGNTTATCTIALTGTVSGDTVSATGTGTFADKNVGTGKKVTCSSITLSGTSAGNYTLSTTSAETTANITAKSLTPTATASNKTYNGNTTATCTIALTGTISGDTVTASAGSGAFADKNVGTGKKVTCSSITLSGTDKGNYTLSSTSAETTANITAKSLTVANFTYSPLTKVYDKGTTAPSGFSVTATTASGLISGDTVTVSYTGASYNDADVADASSIAVSGMSISGTSASNYTLSSTSYTKTGATITKATGTISLSPRTATYTGSAIAANTATTNSGGTVTYTYYSGDTCSGTVLSGAPTNAGPYSVIASVVATGNYTGATTGCIAHTINKKSLTPTATASNKTYNGNTAASCTIALTGTVSGDTVSATGTGTFADKNVGTSKKVTCSSITLSGADKDNYSLSGTSVETTANITAKSLTPTASASNKTYNGNTTASCTISLTGTVTGDTVSATGTGTFADKNVGTGKKVTCSSITLSGTNAGNYTLSSTSAETTANITAKSLTPTATASNKTYNGNTTATCTIALTGTVSGDTVTASAGSGAFADKNVGTGKKVTCSSITLSGTNAGNYTLSSTSAETTANITAKSLTPTASASNKTYNGNTTASCTIALTGTVSGDTVSATAGSGAFADKNVGTGKKVTCSSITLSGTNAGNYTLSSTSAETTANITAKTLTPTATASNKTYNGNTTASCTIALTGTVSGDTVSATAGSGAFADKNVGTGKKVTCSSITLSGADKGNYTLSSTSAETTANITKYTPTLAISKTSGSVAANSTSTFTATPTTISSCLGTLAATSASTSYVTITGGASTSNAASGTAVTITYKGVSYTTGTNITVSYTPTDTTNCNSASSKTFAASVTRLTPTVTLDAKTATYTGSAIAANTAKATYGGSSVSLSYTYKYYTESTCTTLTTTATGASASGGAPVNARTTPYYVQATSNQTGVYASAKSPCVAHTINKATPDLTLNKTSGTVEAGSTATFTATTKSTPNAAGTLTAVSGTTANVTITGGASTSITATSSGVSTTITYKGTSTEGNSTITVKFTPSDTTNFETVQKTFTATNDDTIAPTVPTYVAKFAESGASYSQGSWATKQVNTTISSTDAGTGVARIQYILKDTYDKNTSASWSTFNFSVSKLTQSGTTWTGTEPWGTQTRNQSYYFRACDVAGNCSSNTGVVYTIKYDQDAPTVSYKAYYESGGAAYNQGDYALTRILTDISGVDSHSGVDRIEYILKDTYDKDATATWTKFNFSVSNLAQSGTTWTGTEGWGATEGRNQTYYFRACDKVGNCTAKANFALYTIKYATSATIPTAASYCNSLTYNGSSQTLVKTAGTGYTWTAGTTRTDAGSQNVTATLKEGYKWSGNTTGTKTISCSIAQKPVTYKADNASKTYDGSALTKNTATLTSGSLVSGHSATFTISGTITNAGTATNTLSAVVIKNSGGTDVSANYAITKQNGTLTVNQATPTLTISPTSGTVVAGKTMTFTEKANVAGSFANSSGSTSVATVSPASNASVAANTAKTETVTGVASGTSTITVTFTPTSSNYKAVSGTYTATVTKSATPPTTSYCNSLTYNGSSQTLVKTAGTGYTWTAGTTRTDAGSQNVTATLASGYRWNDNSTGTKTISCSIAQKPVTYKADDASKTYNGSALTKNSATLTSGSLVSGHSATFTISGTITNAGTATNTLSAVVIKNSGGTDVSANYAITKQNGTLTVNQATPTLTISPTSGTVVAGKTMTFTEKANVAGSFANSSGSTSVATVSPASNASVAANTAKTETVTGVASGTSTITVTFTPTSSNYKAVSGTYTATVTKSATPPTNSLCVSRTYTGAAQQLTSVTSGTGYTLSGYSQTNAGSYTITATLASGYRWSDNATGTKTFTCSIAKATPTITLSASSGTVLKGKTITYTATVKSGAASGSVSGTLKATSGTTSVATVTPTSTSISSANNSTGVATTETVTGVAAGSSTITMSFTPSDTTNYNSASNKTYTATVVNNTMSCSFSGPATSWIKASATTTYTLNCTDSYSFSDSTLTSSDFTLSTSGIVTLSTPTKSTITNGYKYTITVTGAKQGTTTLTLKAGVLSDIYGGTNAAVTSSAVGVDTTTPTVSFSKAGGIYSGAQTINITAADTGGSGFYYMDIHTYKDGVYDETKSVNTRTSTTYSVTLDAGYYWIVHAKVFDKAGNIINPDPNNGDGWYFQEYWPTQNVTFDSTNLVYGIDNLSSTTANNATYSISNGVFTVKANSDDGFVYTTARVYLEANRTYNFSVTTNGTWGAGGDTVESYFQNETTGNHIHMNSANYNFTPTESGVYKIRLDVNTNGKQYTFSNLSVREIMIQGFVKGNTYPIPTLQPIRPGYVFNGWYTAASGGTQVSTITTITTASAHTIYAHWTYNPTCSWTSSTSTVYNSCASSAIPTNPVAGSTYAECSNVRYRYSLSAGTCNDGRSFSAYTSGYDYVSANSAVGGCTGRKYGPSGCITTTNGIKSGGNCTTSWSATRTVYTYVCS